MVRDIKPPAVSLKPQKRPTQYWRWLLPPMLLASIGLHGLVLFVPMAPSDEDLVPPPDPEEDGIAITKIDAPRSRAAAPSAATTGTVKTAPPATARSGAAARPAPQPRPARPAADRGSTPRRGQEPQAADDTSNADGQPPPTVPGIPQVDPVQSPNGPSPGVGNPPPPGTNVAANSGPDPFEEYVKVFATYNGLKVSDAEAESLQQSWLDSFHDRGPDFADLDVQPLDPFDPLPYAANICLPSPPTTAEVLVLVDSDGELDEYKEFVQRTGYRDFDDAAIAQVEDYEFPNADGPQAFLAQVPVDYDAENCDWPPNVDKLPPAYFDVLDKYVGPTLTSPADAEAAQANWLQSLAAAEEIDLPETSELTPTALEGFDGAVEYPLAICLPIEPKDAKWGVVVGTDGHLVGEPTQLRSTGYENFDDRAEELVKAFDFPTTDTPMVYAIEVPVDYNDVNCQPLDSEEFEVKTAASSGSSSHSNGENDVASDGAAATGDAAATNPPASELIFDPEEQALLVARGRENVLADGLGSLNALPDQLAASVESGWPDDVDRTCFITELNSATGITPAATAEDALVLLDTMEFAPSTVSRLYGVEVGDAGEYCGAPLFKMAIAETPKLFSSIVEFEGDTAIALVVIWANDPRK